MAWPKGKKRSQETIKKLSETCHWTGTRGPMFGKHHSEETRKIISEKGKGRPGSMLGKHHTKEHIEKIRNKMKGLHSGSSNPMFGRRGSLSPNWKGGITKERCLIQGSFKYINWRQDIFKRDNFTCQECGESGGCYLEVHHKNIPYAMLLKESMTYLPLLSIYDAAMLYTPMWDISNGITLCKKCHKNKHKKVRV